MAPYFLIDGEKIILSKTSTKPSGQDRIVTSALQNELNKVLGINLSVDGWYGNNTANAIKGLQGYYGLPQTGALDIRTFAQLEKAFDNNVFIKVRIPSTITPNTGGTGIGSKEAFDDKKLQRLAEESGASTVTIDQRTGKDEPKVPNLIDTLKMTSDATILGPLMVLGIISGRGDPSKTTATATIATTVAVAEKVGEKIVEEKGQQVVYTLREVGTDIVKYVGRTINPKAREAAYKLIEEKKDLIFTPEKSGMTYNQVRGAEQMLFKEYGGFENLLNKINPISPKNLKLTDYLKAFEDLLK